MCASRDIFNVTKNLYLYFSLGISKYSILEKQFILFIIDVL